MTKFLGATLVLAGLSMSGAAFAGEQTVTLAVKNMYCAACPFTVQKSLEAVPGVAKVVVSYADETAIVIFDDAKATVPALIAATTNAGYPSEPKSDPDGRPANPISSRALVSNETMISAIRPDLPEVRRRQA